MTSIAGAHVALEARAELAGIGSGDGGADNSVSTGPTVARYHFYPVSRRGGATALDNADPLSGPLPLRGQPNVEIEVAALLNGAPAQSLTGAPAGLQLYGPGDVVGFDVRHIVRTEPSDGTANFEPNYFAGIEFDDPDLPWMFTPAQAAPTADQATARARLRPWVGLLVLADDECVYTRPGSTVGLATIAVKDEPKILPPPDESWLWAHTQLTGDLGTDTLDDVLTNHPERLVSRVLCPRQLQPDTHYTAYLVPTFEAGRTAGLGQSGGDGGGAAPTNTTAAWTASAPGTTITMPVYFSFSFATAAAGDFISLALRLTPEVLSGVGQRTLGVDDERNQAHWDMPPATQAGTPLHLSGALTAVPPLGPAPADQWGLADRQVFQPALANLLNQATPATADPKQKDPTVVPPTYGAYHAVLSVDPAGVGWVNQLNLDPRLRGPAGVGAAVVTAERAQLMASAWRQISGVEKANQVLRHAQLARASLQQSYRSTLSTVTTPTLFTLTSAVQRRVVLDGQTVWSALASSPIPWRILRPGVRRLTRPRGPWRTRQGAVGRSLDGLITDLNSGELSVAPFPGPAIGSVTMPAALPTGSPGSSMPTATNTTPASASGRGGWWLLISAACVVVALIMAGLLVHAIVAGGTGAGILVLLAIAVAVELWAAAWFALRGVRTGGVASVSTAGPGTQGNSGVGGGPPPPGSSSSTAATSGSGGTVAGGSGALPGAGVAVSAPTPAPRPAGGSYLSASLTNGRRPAFAYSIPGAASAPVTASSSVLDSADATRFRRGLTQLSSILVSGPAGVNSGPLDIGALGTGLLGSLDPTVTVVARAQSLVSVSALAGWQPADPIEPIMAAPSFPQPMYKPLRDLSQEYVLPGVGSIPADSVGLLSPDQAFIEAYMVGLNVEMGRQLLWNGYPTDQRGSYFRQFWDVSCYVPGPNDPPLGSAALQGELFDIAAITSWNVGTPLGSHANPANPDAAGALVLVLRGELLRRYPTTVIYAVPAALDPQGGTRSDGGPALKPVDDPSQEIHPLFRGTLAPDLTYLGFPLTESEALTGGGGYGYFFVLQQHPTEPRFGLESAASQQSGSVTWQDFQQTNIATQATQPTPDGSALPTVSSLWGVDSAHTAWITFRQPSRIALWAQVMLPEPTATGG